MEVNQSKVFLVHFLKKWKYLEFCLPELEALAGMCGVNPTSLYNEKTPKNGIDIKASPYVYVNLPNVEAAKQIQSRSVLIGEILNVFSQANNSWDQLIKNVDKEALG
jgi:hypothetical protein